MSFYDEFVDPAVQLLAKRKRVSYSALRVEFDLNDQQLGAVRDEIIYGLQVGVDQGGKVLVWVGEQGGVDTEKVTEAERGPTSETPVDHDEVPAPSFTEILTSQEAIEGVRKRVTVFFADLVGSTKLANDLDPEDTYRLVLYPAQQAMMEAVQRYEGTVNQVLGDGIMALFGAPVAHEDHAVRACYAALDLKQAMARYAEELHASHGLPLHIRVGLNSGEVVVRAVGNSLHMDYTAIGQPVNLASRMEQLADFNAIFMMPATKRLVEGFVELRNLGPKSVKGLPEPVEVFELLRAGPTKRRFHATAQRGLSQFVGRKIERQRFETALDEARQGRGRLLAVVGEPGVGKSRLAYEFILSAVEQGWRVLESSAVSYGKVKAYFPVIELLRQYFELDDDETVESSRAKVPEQVYALDKDLKEIIPPLLMLLGALPEDNPFLRLDLRDRQQQTLNALKQLLLRESRERPLLVVFEDLHSIDEGTQAFLDRLVQSLPAARLLLLVNYRPEYQHPWGSGFSEQIRLDRLPPSDSNELLHFLIGSDVSLEPLKQTLFERTGGNPFFLEESVRNLTETNVLIGTRGAYRLARALPTTPLPDTVQAILAARIDRLESGAKRLLQTAAVIGTEVPVPLLKAISNLGEDALQRHLERLQATEFLYETNLYPEHVFTFTHALTNEVAYGSLLQERRRRLHASIVDVLESLSENEGDALAERIAPHAFRGELWDKAFIYLRSAGRNAMSRSAFHEAVTCFDQALKALQSLPERHETLEDAVDLRLELRNALFMQVDFERIQTCLLEAEAIAAKLGDTARLARVLNFLCASFGMAGDQERAIECGQQAVTLASAREDLTLKIVANYYLGVAYRKRGQYPRAVDALKQALELIPDDLRHERFGTGAVLSVICRSHLVQSLAEIGAFEEGLHYAREGTKIAKEVNHAYSLMHLNWSRGVLFLIKGEFDQAISVLRPSHEYCVSKNMTVLLPLIASSLGYAQISSRRAPEALNLLKQGAEEKASTGRVGSFPARIAWLSEARLLLGDSHLKEAHELGKRAFELSSHHQEHGNTGWTLRLLGRLAQQRGDTAEAESRYRDALELAEELGMRPLESHCYFHLGTLYLQIGQHDRARKHLMTSIESYKEQDMTFWHAEASNKLSELTAALRHG